MKATPLWRRPIWLLGHLIALTACVLFVQLGFWQLERLDERRDRNELIRARSLGAPVDALSVARLDEAEYRNVTARGRFDLENEVTIRNRTLAGSVGRHVVTPMVLEDGSWLYVHRGWIPVDGPVPPPEDGVVTVEGVLRASEVRGSLGPRDPAEGVLDELNRVDLGRLQQQAPRGVEVLPVWLQQTAPDTESPILLEPLPLDEGPHLSYAVQWFLFTGVVGIGYPILLRRRMQQQPSAPSAPRAD